MPETPAEYIKVDFKNKGKEDFTIEYDVDQH